MRGEGNAQPPTFKFSSYRGKSWNFMLDAGAGLGLQSWDGGVGVARAGLGLQRGSRRGCYGFQTP